MTTNEKMSLFRAGVEYYVAGRYAMSAGLVDITGNLFHHAIEMMFKGYLSDRLTLTELSKKPYGHNLNHLWDRIKQIEADASLNQYDQTVTELHEFESIRYPEKTLAQGKTMSLGFFRRPATSLARQNASMPLYELYVKEIDDLVSLLFVRASLNPRFYFMNLRGDARTYLCRENDASWVK